MKFVRSHDINASNGTVSKDLVRRIYGLFRSSEFADKLITEYGVFSKEGYDSNFRQWLAAKLPNQLLPIYHVLNGDVSKKKILDLGCGSYAGTYESIEFNPRYYEPWLCRTLLELGAHPIGIDIGDLDEEIFEHETLNMLSLNSLGLFMDNSIDVAHADLLYDSPTLERMNGCDLRELLIPQLERIVKPDGYFIEGM